MDGVPVQGKIPRGVDECVPLSEAICKRIALANYREQKIAAGLYGDEGMSELKFTGDTCSHSGKAENSSPVELYQSAKTTASALESRDREARLRFYFREISKLYLSLIKGALITDVR